jgi:hypothetical protein
MKEALKRQLEEKLAKAKVLAAKTNLTDDERKSLRQQVREIEALRDEYEQAKAVDAALSDLSPASDGGGSGNSLSTALKSAGFDYRTRPYAEVPSKAATVSGDITDVNTQTSGRNPALGADTRFLAPHLPTEPVPSDATSVSSFRQTSRALGDTSLGIRDIDATSDKPDIGSTFQAVGTELKQIAFVETGIPAVLMAQLTASTSIARDLQIAYSKAVDAHVLAQIAASNPTPTAGNADKLAAILDAAGAVADSGYAPRALVASPATFIELALLRQPGTDDYVGTRMDHILDGMQKIAVGGLDKTYVMDTEALGTFYQSPTRFQVFEENSGRTNTFLARFESNGLYVVQRPQAIIEVDFTP